MKRVFVSPRRSRPAMMRSVSFFVYSKRAKKDTERIIAGLERRGEKSTRSKIEEILRSWEELKEKEAEVKERKRN